MRVTVFGGGNIGTEFAVMFAEKGHDVTVFTSRPDEINTHLEIADETGRVMHSGEIRLVTNDPSIAVADADCIFITFPAFMMAQTAKMIAPHVKRGAWIGMVPGTGGGEFAFSEVFKTGCVVFGLQRVPGVARLVEYGKRVCVAGLRPRLHVGVIPQEAGVAVARMLSENLQMPCTLLANYLTVTLTPSNPILHTTRLRTLFSDYHPGVVYERNPLFYGDWNDASSELLLACDGELQQVCHRFAENGVDLSGVHSLRQHYESNTVQELTRKISSIESLHSLPSPMEQIKGGYLPDFSSRYFTADFPYGLAIIQEIAKLAEVEIPYIDATMDWYRKVTHDMTQFRLAQYGVYVFRDLCEFYAR